MVMRRKRARKRTTPVMRAVLAREPGVSIERFVFVFGDIVGVVCGCGVVGVCVVCGCGGGGSGGGSGGMWMCGCVWMCE